jgi:hypothetical protein
MATKKPMKKVKRYEGGGEIEEAAAKQRGLDESNKEKPVGFFERIRMGNIDDPSSEAYKRFGAGRGRSSPAAEEDGPQPVARPSAKPTPIFAADEMQQRAKEEGAKISEGERISNMPASAKPVAPVKAEKAKVVTKAELEKSGMSLRDYLNKQQGLTRKESAKESVKESVKAAVPDAEILEAKRVARYTPPGSAPKQSMGRQRQPFMPGEVDNTFPGAKFKGGGKVRSASARADGIAIRGKTRA